MGAEDRVPSAGVAALPLCRLLPFDFPDRLAAAAAVGDMAEVDRITDQLARRYPHLVRRRWDAGQFESAALARRLA